MRFLLHIAALIVHLLALAAVAEHKFEISAEQRAYWAFQPVARPDADGIDAIVDQALAERGLIANPPATREQLIRRAYFDLTGLAPRSVRKLDYKRTC